jgi:hypothetical protein
MARRYATIFQLTSDSVEMVELLNEARHILNLVMIPGGLRKIELRNQHFIPMPIWDIDGPCVIKIIISITEAMKHPAVNDIDYVRIYRSLGSCRKSLQPYTEVQKPA